MACPEACFDHSVYGISLQYFFFIFLYIGHPSHKLSPNKLHKAQSTFVISPTFYFFNQLHLNTPQFFLLKPSVLLQNNEHRTPYF